MKNKNYIIFSSINWTTHWQIHHQLTKSIVNAGGRVLFVENTGVRSPKLRDCSRVIDRIKSRLNSIHGFRGIESGVTLFTPLFIPFPYSKIAIFLNGLYLYQDIKKWIKSSPFDSNICISFLPTPSVQEIIKKIGAKVNIYYCADDMSRSLNNPNKLEEYENIFFNDVDLVFTTSHKIYERASKYSDYVYNIPAGIDSNKFPPAETPLVPNDIKNITGPVIGYTGAISDVFDKQLVVGLAHALPNVFIVIVGPKYTDISVLQEVKNIVLLGEKPHDLMPAYIASFDVAVIPYIVNEATNSVYSCKLNEYLSMGKMVLSTDLQEINIFNMENDNLIDIGVNKEDFINKAKWLISEKYQDSESRREYRVKVANQNTWDKRFYEITDAIDNRLKLKLKHSNWQDSLRKKYINSRKSVLRVVLFICFYLIIFHSPFFWYIGEKLIIDDELIKSDAIVIFSGDGVIDYRNLSYQRRALEAIELYKNGYADKIFISSGREQTISDVEMIRLYVTSRGVPASSLVTLDKYPASTYSNVVMQYNELLSNNINSIIFLTGPYHSLRSELLWDKNAPDIEVITPDLRSLTSKKVQWRIDFKTIQVVLYEYIAIMHNWFVGRI